MAVEVRAGGRKWNRIFAPRSGGVYIYVGRGCFDPHDARAIAEILQLAADEVEGAKPKPVPSRRRTPD